MKERITLIANFTSFARTDDGSPFHLDNGETQAAKDRLARRNADKLAEILNGLLKDYDTAPLFTVMNVTVESAEHLED